MYASTPPNVPKPSSLSNEVLKRLALENPVRAAAAKDRQWKDLFDGNLCIGEVHRDVSPKKFLIQNMALLKSKGFDTIFMEHLNQDDHWGALQDFHETGRMSEDLRRDLAKMDNGHMGFLPEDHEAIKSFNFTNVVIAAQRHGIRVIPLEESKELWGQYRSGPERMRILSSMAKSTIDPDEDKPSNKWIAFIGSAHLYTYDGVPGFCDILPNAQDLLIMDAKSYFPAKQQCLKEPSSSGIGDVAASMMLIVDFRDDLSCDSIASLSGCFGASNAMSNLSTRVAADSTNPRNKRHKSGSLGDSDDEIPSSYLSSSSLSSSSVVAKVSSITDGARK